MLRALADLVAPIRCIGCARLGEGLCSQCIRQLPGGRSRVSGVPVNIASVEKSFVQVVVVWKDQRARYLTKPLAKSLVKVLPRTATGVLVPIPSRQKSMYQRGWSPLHEVSLALSQETRLMPVFDLLRWQRQPLEQRSLTNVQRQENMKDAFAVTRLERRGVWLLDDVMTSGATLHSAISTLQASGARVNGCLVLAAPRIRR